MIGTLRPGPPPQRSHPDPAVQLLLDRLAIEDLFHSYAASVDRRDFAGVAACFAPDVRGRFGGEERRNRDELVEFISGVAFFHTTLHMLGNTLIEVNGDRAQLDTDAMIKHHATLEDGSDYQLNMSGSRYGERLERRAGEWCIAERAVPPVWGPTGVCRETSRDPALRWLLDRAEIHDLLASYAIGVDTRDYARVRACFAEKFEANYLGNQFDEIEALIDFVRGVELLGWTRHFMSRMLLELRGDRAKTETLALISHRPADDAKPGDTPDPSAGRKPSRERMGVGRYHDEWVREHGRWRIRRRSHGVASAPLRPQAPQPEASDPALRYLLDRAGIADLVVAFGAGLDRGDRELLAACTSTELRVELGDGSGQSRDLFLEAQCERLRAGHTEHRYLGNQLVRLSENRAEVETYVYLSHQAAESRRYSPWHENALRWEQQLVRDEGGWRIAAHRECSNFVDKESGDVEAASDA